MLPRQNKENTDYVAKETKEISERLYTGISSTVLLENIPTLHLPLNILLDFFLLTLITLFYPHLGKILKLSSNFQALKYFTQSKSVLISHPIQCLTTFPRQGIEYQEEVGS